MNFKSFYIFATCVINIASLAYNRIIVWDADIEEILNNAINRLPERCREIFIMSRLQNLRYKEIAEKLNVSPNTVENQIVIALRKLKEDLKDYFPLFVFII